MPPHAFYQVVTGGTGNWRFFAQAVTGDGSQWVNVFPFNAKVRVISTIIHVEIHKFAHRAL